MARDVMHVAAIDMVRIRPAWNVGKNNEGRKSYPYFSTPA